MNPETIRALLAGITAGEWWEAVEHETGSPITPDYWYIRTELPPVPDGRYIVGITNKVSTAENAEFIAAAPGIARYALELAAALERVRDQSIDEDTGGCAILWCEVNYLGVGNPEHHARDCPAGIARAALAPQPAPTEGAG